MPTSLLILSDTHIPSRAKTLPEALWPAVESADIVVHAGDWADNSFFEELRRRSRRLLGCYGNNDGDALRARLPLVAREQIEGLRFAVVHETGAKTGREQRMDREFPDTDVLVFGHSHIPWDTVTGAGMRLLNPGSPTDRRRQPHCSYLTATIDGHRLDVDLHLLPVRA
ncbi:metallophosphoesterase family protein [Arthrobacter zhaoguopingii]|uniref:metallophosphoesterase family protein n=1 Tax=Arthrobacter zhaoguopingii TaxID=2681491 RepID=UPI0013571F6B|nr:YfcE family phosphodiesterase [Arthrobacter zhaoguopingii]